ncbi:unnamed protein product, partial [Penicillium pancosmium]
MGLSENMCSLTPFKIQIPDEKWNHSIDLTRLFPRPPPTFEGSNSKFGITNEWMKNAKKEWLTFDWKADKERLNKLLHFIGDVSLILLHGWPGSFLEYIATIEAIKSQYPGELNIIVPSLPGFLFSTGPPLDRDFGIEDVAFIMNDLMAKLGFGAEHGGYLAHGSDIESLVARALALNFEGCLSIH